MVTKIVSINVCRLLPSNEIESRVALRLNLDSDASILSESTKGSSMAFQYLI